MKNRYTRTGKHILIIVSFVIVLFSCLPPFGVFAPGGEGTLVVSFASIVDSRGAAGFSRTVVPSFDLGITAITVTVTHPGGVSNGTVDSSSELCVIPGIVPGQVTVEAAAHAGEALVAVGTEGPFDLPADGTKAVRIALLPADGAGTGSILLTKLWPVSTGAEYVECSLDGGPAESRAVTVQDDFYRCTFERQNVTAGVHVLSVTFYDNEADRNVLGAFVEAVNVYANCRSDSWLDGTGEVFPERVFTEDELKSSLWRLSKLVITGTDEPITLSPAGTPELVPAAVIDLGKVDAAAVSFTAWSFGWHEGMSIGCEWNGADMGQIGFGVSSGPLSLADGAEGNTLVITVTSPIGESLVYTLKLHRGYRLRYHGNGALDGAVPEEGLYSEGEAVVIPGNPGEITRFDDHAAAGWNTKEDGTGEWYFVGDTYTMGAADATLYARWKLDAGASWTEREVPGAAGATDWYGVACSEDGMRIAACEWDGSIWTSSDGGETWSERTGAGSRDWRGIACSADGMTIVACDYYQGFICTSLDGGRTWTERTGAGNRIWNCIASSAEGRLVAGGSNMMNLWTSP